MAFTSIWTEVARQQYQELRDNAEASLKARKADKNKKASKAEGLFKQVNGCIQKLLYDPRNPGLQTHKYDSLINPYNQKHPVFEAYAQNRTPGAYRVFWCYGPRKDQITIIAIAPHP